MDEGIVPPSNRSSDLGMHARSTPRPGASWLYTACAIARDVAEDGTRTAHVTCAAVKDFTSDLIRDVTTQYPAMPHRRIGPRSWSGRVRSMSRTIADQCASGRCPNSAHRSCVKPVGSSATGDGYRA
jgi:hypothetical protein